VREHVEERADHSFQLWSLLMLELWQQEFVDACAPVVDDIQGGAPPRSTASALAT
jgi:hypothetical protein